jgi:ribokinase
VSEAVAPEFFSLCDIVCPNEHEARLLTGRTVATLDDAEAAARILLAQGAPTVIITLGERGSLLVCKEQVLPVPAPIVQTVDSTGAGDAFVGSLAYFLAAGVNLPEAMHRASQIAAISVQTPGTQTSYPYARDLPAALFEQ